MREEDPPPGERLEAGLRDLAQHRAGEGVHVPLALPRLDVGKEPIEQADAVQHGFHADLRRLDGDRYDHPGLRRRERMDVLEHALRMIDVLEHLRAQDHIELAALERESLHCVDLEQLDSAAEPLEPGCRVLQGAPGDVRAGDATRRRHARQQATRLATDLQYRVGGLDPRKLENGLRAPRLHHAGQAPLIRRGVRLVHAVVPRRELWVDRAERADEHRLTIAYVPDKPEVTIPEGAPPTALAKEDLVVGTGAEATAGRTVEVHYVGVAWSTKKQFDASWDRGRPFDFPLGAGRVIRGWDDGVAGMRVGGRRRLVIPPDLGYGARGAGGAIGPNETLVFVVDLLAVR